MGELPVIYLAAGRGSRLTDLTSDKPKALVEAGGRTLADRAFEYLRAAGFGAVGILVLMVSTWRRSQDRGRYLRHLAGTFVVAFVVSRFTATVPLEVQEIVESIRFPKGAGEAHDH